MNKIVEVYDIETIKNCFTFTGLDINTKKVFQFVIHNSRNDLISLIDHLNNINGQIGYNNLNFDGQVIQWILDNYKDWLNLTGEKIANKIYDYAQHVINKTNNGSWADYPEWKLKIKQLDLFKIWHFDNKAKMTSLKWIEYSIDFPNIEEMPISHDTLVTEDQIQSILNYNLNDVLATYEFYKITIGETEHPLYKRIDKVQLRKDIINEFGINCINYNDVKIGDEINKFKYCQLSGIDKKQLPKPNKEIKSFKFKDCFPNYIKFETIEFNNFINIVGNVIVKLKKETDKDKQEFEFSFNGTTYLMAKGGLHSKDLSRIVKPLENELLKDCDVGSMYPNAIVKRNLFPKHLGDKWLIGYKQIIDERILAKKKYKETKESKYQSIQETYKLSLNGGGFGKTKEDFSWQFDPFVTYCVTIGSQIDLLMLIERLEINNIHVISANTDGLVCLFDKSLEETYYKCCKDWEIQVGNDKSGQLEYTDYKLLVQTSVNSYLAIKTDNEVKTKSEFVSDFEIHKNKSARIVPLALQDYFVKGIPVKDTIMNHKNIFDFCLGTKSIGTNRLIHLEPIKGNEIKLQKINRYYVSNDGWHLLKRLKPLENKKISRQLDIFGNENDGTRESEIEAGWKTTIYNKHIDKPIDQYNINYKYYIDNCQKIIDKIENKQ
jgi:hypothetical protein